MALPWGAIQVTIISFVIMPLAIATTFLRLWSRRLKNQSLGFPDYMALVALLLAAATVSVFLAAGFAAGLGLHLVDIMATDPSKFVLHMKLFVPAQLLWAAANSCVKFSILSLYTALFPGKRFCRICQCTMVVTIAYFIMVFLETFLLCKPVQYNWDKSIQGICQGENTAYLVAGITNLVIDTFIVVLPMPRVFKLQMSLPRRISVAAMFSLGVLICVLSLLRVHWLATWDLTDLTYTETPGAIYSVLEPTLGVVNACLPTIRPAVIQIMGPNVLNWTKREPESNGSAEKLNNRGRKHGGSVKGNLTREFERLEDEFPLNDVVIQGDQGTRHANGNSITVNREFRLNSSTHTMV